MNLRCINGEYLDNQRLANNILHISKSLDELQQILNKLMYKCECRFKNEHEQSKSNVLLKRSKKDNKSKG